MHSGSSIWIYFQIWNLKMRRRLKCFQNYRYSVFRGILKSARRYKSKIDDEGFYLTEYFTLLSIWWPPREDIILMIRIINYEFNSNSKLLTSERTKLNLCYCWYFWKNNFSNSTQIQCCPNISERYREYIQIFCLRIFEWMFWIEIETESL